MTQFEINHVVRKVGKTLEFFKRHSLFLLFVVLHVLFAVFLGRMFAFAPDEGGYLQTFNMLYQLPSGNAQLVSGWITAPTVFLWIAYLPAKIMSMCGVSDLLAIRFLSIFLLICTYVIIRTSYREVLNSRLRENSLLLSLFCIPSVFVWTSLGLREAFILISIALILKGLKSIDLDKTRIGLVSLIGGSYSLLCVKNYLWLCLVIGVVVSSFIWFAFYRKKRFLLFKTLGLILIPVVAFTGTTSVYALNFMFHTNINVAGERSGDSITKVIVSQESGKSEVTPGKSEILTFHGDYTLIAIHSFIEKHPDSALTKATNFLGISEKVDDAFRKKLEQGLIRKNNGVPSESAARGSHILEPGKLSNPISVVRASFLFLFGPLPLSNFDGVIGRFGSIESPIWWLLYGVLLMQVMRVVVKKSGLTQTAVNSFGIFVVFIGFSSLVEVNLGTSFRHRSILLIPVLFLILELLPKHERKKS